MSAAQKGAAGGAVGGVGGGAAAIRLQPLTRARVATLGDAGTAWHARLAVLLAELAQRWQLDLGRDLPGGSASYVCRATRRTASGDLEPVVVKVALDAADVEAQSRLLDRADGRGYVRLLAVDHQRQALLMEQLGSSLDAAQLPVTRQLDLLAATLGQAWLAPDTRSADPAAREDDEHADADDEDDDDDKARQLAALITRSWQQLGEPGSAAAVRRALGYAETLAGCPVEESVVVHGDPHPGNLLQVPVPRAGAETGYCFVDPDGFVADPAYDLGVTLRDWSARILAADRPETLLRGWCDRMAEQVSRRAGSGAAGGRAVDPERIWRWAFLERVSTGLYVLGFGAERAAEPFLRSAARLVGDG